MQKIPLKIFLLILSVCVFRVGLAQVFPVQLSTQLIPPYSGYLPDYGDPTNEKLRCILMLQDLTVTHRDVKLEITITGNGFTIKTKNNFLPEPITLFPGIPALVTGTDLAPYLETQNLDFSGINVPDYELHKVLPEGYYSICISVLDYYNTDHTVISNESCNSAWFFLNDPPYLNFPLCGSEVTPFDPQNILFQWTAMNLNSPNSAFNTEYDFELFEVRPNGAVPNNIVQTSAPIFSITTTQPFFQYGITEPILYTGMEYVWRVRARDITGRDVFKNDGYSQICTFTYGDIAGTFGENAFTLTLNAQATTHRQGKLWWNLISNFSEYHIQLRKSGTENWFDYFSVTSEIKINMLEPSTAYEARVMGTGDDLESEWSNLATFTTPSIPVIQCNDQNIPINALGSSPLLSAFAGMIFQIGQFEMTATSISPDGIPGYYSGEGYVKTFGVKIKVHYEHVYINDNLQITLGNVFAVTEGIDSWIDNWELDQAIDNAVFIDDVIDSIFVEDSLITIITADGDTTQYNFPGNGGPIVFNDSEGNQYIVYPDGTIVQGSYFNYSTDHLDCTNENKIVFSAAEDQKYGLDNFEIPQWHNDYEIIKLSDSTNYYVTNKSIKAGGDDYVLAEGNSVAGLSFTNANGENLQSEIIGNKIKIHLQNFSEDGSIYAVSGNQRLGKLNVKVYEEEEKEVVLIPLNGAATVDLSVVSNLINQSFGEAVCKWNVSAGNALTISDWDENGNGKIDIDDYTLLNKYSDEMDNIRNAFSDTSISDDAYILFVVPGFGDESIDGYMPYGRRFGFIKSGANAKAYAHELAHGAFGLQHTFPDVEQGSTDNLLDYGNGIHLASWQWEWMRSGHWLENLNSSMAEIEYSSADELSPWLEIANNNHDFTGFSFPFINGKTMKISNVRRVTFNRYGQVYDFELNNGKKYRSVTTTGSYLVGFIDQEKYQNYAGKILTAELNQQLSNDLLISTYFKPAGNTDSVVTYARKRQGDFLIDCHELCKWKNTAYSSVETKGAWKSNFTLPENKIVVSYDDIDKCNVDLAAEGVNNGAGVKLYLGLYKNYPQGSTERQKLAELANYFSDKIGEKKFAFYGYGLENNLFGSSFTTDVIRYFKDNNINEIAEFENLFPFDSDFSRDFEIIFSKVQLRENIPSNYNANSRDYARSSGEADVLYEYSFKDLVAREGIKDEPKLWVVVLNNENAGTAKPVNQQDFYNQYVSKYQTASSVFFIAEWSARWAKEPLIAYTFYRAAFLAPEGMGSLITANTLRNAAIGGMVDYLLQLGIIYYFGEDDITFDEVLSQVDYYEIGVAAFTSSFASASKIQMLVDGGAECLYNGFTENGAFTGSFDYVDCARGVMVALLMQKMAHGVITTIKAMPVGRVYMGLQKLGGFSKEQLENLLTWLGFSSDDIANVISHNLDEIVRGVSKSDFIESVGDFVNNPQLADEAYALWKNQDWAGLENFVNMHSINGGWPPNHGFIDMETVSLEVGFEFDRYGGRFTNGEFSDIGNFVSPLGASFESRALPANYLNTKPYKKYKVIKRIDNVKKGQAIPWFGQEGNGIQYQFTPDYRIDYLVQNGFIEEIN